MSHWKKHIFLFQTLDAAVQRLAGWDRPEFAWRTGAMGWGTSLGCKGEMLEPPSLGGGCTHGAQRTQSCWWDPAQPRVAPELRNTGAWSHPKQAGAAWEKPLVPQEGAETAAFVHGRQLSQGEDASQAGFSGETGTRRHELCRAARSCFPPPGSEQRGCCGGPGDPRVWGWAQPVIWRARCIPAWLSFSACCFLCRAMPARQPRTPHFLLASLPPLRHLSLGSSSRPACCRGRRPPSSFPSFLVAVSPGLHSALPRGCLQHRQIFSDTHIPLCSEQSISSSAGIVGRSPYPQIWGPRAGFCSSQVLGAVPHLHWRLPAQLGALGLAPHSGHCC